MEVEGEQSEYEFGSEDRLGGLLWVLEEGKWGGYVRISLNICIKSQNNIFLINVKYYENS